MIRIESSNRIIKITIVILKDQGETGLRLYLGNGHGPDKDLERKNSKKGR